MPEERKEDTQVKESADTQEFVQDELTGDVTLKDIFNDVSESIITSDHAIEGEANASDTGEQISEQGSDGPGESQVDELGQENSTDNEEVPNDEKRYEYWQSQYDKLKNQYEGEKHDIEQARLLHDAIKADPGLLDHVRTYYKGGDVAPNPANVDLPQVQESKLEEPPRPEQYDPYDAYDKPDSESYKWRVKHENWIVEKAEANAVKRAQAIYDKQIEEVREKQAKEMQRAKEAQILNDFRSRHSNIDDAKFGEFIQWANDPKNMSFDNVWKLYNAVNADENQRKSAEKVIREQYNRTQAIPDPAVGVQSPPPEPKKSPDDLLWEDILKVGNPNSPF